MKRYLLFILILTHQSQSASLFQATFIFDHHFPELQKDVHIEFRKIDSGKIEISYLSVIKGESKKIKKEFSEFVIQELLKKLKTPISGWSSDSNCRVKEYWRFKVEGARKEICSQKELIKGIKNFQSSVELLLRK